MKYAVVTFGCRVNQADSLAIECELASAGGEAVPSDRADLVVVNTCSVTASADQGARQTIRRIARENPSARIVATGCYATRCAAEIATLPGVIAVVPNGEKGTVSFLDHLREKAGHSSSLPLPDGPCGRPLAPGFMGRTAWTLRVQTGCEESCSYCIIPTTRGASRSRAIEDIEAEVRRVIDAGYREIAITGVHLGSYGRDLQPPVSLRQLLGRLDVCEIGRADQLPLELRRSAEASAKAEARPRNRTEAHQQQPLYRISSLEPMDCAPEIVELVAGSTVGPGFSRAVFAPHFHLPLQHASNRILAVMRRPYTIEYYARLVNDIRALMLHASIGSDVIAGFPGETDADFAELTAYLEGSPLTSLHVFPYSDRPGTVAAGLDGKVHGSVIKARAQRLREISRTLQDRFREAQRGSMRPALTIDDGSMAVTDNYFRVPAPPGCARNEWVTVTL